jgi:hypothetical protein
MQMVQREIIAICDAASLTGTAMLSTANIANDTPPSYPLLTAAQQAAGGYAENMVTSGSILGQSLSQATNVWSASNIGLNMTPGGCQYVVSLADPTNNYASASVGNIKGKSISCFIGYGYQPKLLMAVGIGTTVTIQGSSFGGLPQVDAVMVFDYSASMDDQTVVTFVRREWIHDPVNGTSDKMNTVTAATPGCGIIQYLTLASPTNPPTIANYLDWNYNSASGAQGSAVNALPPQNLHATCNDPNGNIGNQMFLDLYLRAHYTFGDSNYTLGGQTGYQEYPAATEGRSMDWGTPPGNCDLSVPFGGNGDGLTDVNGLQAPNNTGPILPCAFTDMTWQTDSGNTYNFEPAAPGARAGTANNDTYPSSDQQTFTDVVVNIAKPSTSGPSGTTTTYPYQQPLNGPNTFAGFSWTFDPLEPDTTLAGATWAFPNIAVVVEAARGNLEGGWQAVAGKTPWSFPCGADAQALLQTKCSINGTVTNGVSNTIHTAAYYQKAYSRLAMMFSQPIATAMLGADQGFYQKLHLLADCCFGFVGFSSRGPFDGGSSPSTTTGYFTTQGTNNDSFVNPTWGRSFVIAYPPAGNLTLAPFPFFLGYPVLTSHTNDGKFTPESYGGVSQRTLSKNSLTYIAADQQTGIGLMGYYIIGPTLSQSLTGFRVPRTQLAVSSPTAGDVDQYLACTSQSPTGNCWSYLGTGANGIYNGRPLSETDTSEALITARLMFNSTAYNITNPSLSRPASKKIIVFFTDGEPTGGISGSEAQATQNIAGPGAGTCAGDGIAIYTIGLNVSNNSTLKSDQLAFLGTSGTGLSALAGNGGQFFPCTSGQDVINAFSAVARRLTQSQR